MKTQPKDKATFGEWRLGPVENDDDWLHENPNRCGGCDVRILGTIANHTTTLATVYDSPDRAALIVQAVNDYDRLKQIEEAAERVRLAILDERLNVQLVQCRETNKETVASISALAQALASTPESARQSAQRQQDYVAALEAVTEAAKLLPQWIGKAIADGAYDNCVAPNAANVHCQHFHEALAKLEQVKP